MSLKSVLLSFFPALTCGLSLGLCLLALLLQQPILFFAGVVNMYVFPLLAFHLHQRLWPLTLGPSHLLKAAYSPWWGTHQIQLIFIAFPFLEEILRLIPGLFSFWLRLWGAKVGRNVYFAPHFRIADRSLIEIGDDVVFGYQVSVSSHIVKKSRHDLLLFVRPIRIGAGAFIGVGVVIGPGVTIEANTSIDGGMHLYPNKVYAGKNRRGPTTPPPTKTHIDSDSQNTTLDEIS